MPNNPIVWQPRKLFDSTTLGIFLYGKQCFFVWQTLSDNQTFEFVWQIVNLFGRHFLILQTIVLFDKQHFCLANDFSGWQPVCLFGKKLDYMAKNLSVWQKV